MKQKLNMKTCFVLLLGVLATPVFAEHSNTKFDTQMGTILKEYLKIQMLLSSDESTGVASAATRIVNYAKSLETEEAPQRFQHHYKSVPNQIQEAASKLSQVSTIGKQREIFKMLSRPIAKWVEMHQPDGAGVYYCGMAKSSWVQQNGKTKNPYYGKSMLRCGQRVKYAINGAKMSGS